MTIFPEQPHLEKVESKDGREMRRLAEDHVTFVSIGLGWSLEIYQKAGFETDGASIPEALSDLFKGPWYPPRMLAVVPHDGLYGIKWLSRLLCDRIYRRILTESRYDSLSRDIEYYGIRLAGWRNWNAVTNEERKEARNYVFVRWIRTKKVNNRKAELKAKGRG